MTNSSTVRVIITRSSRVRNSARLKNDNGASSEVDIVLRLDDSGSDIPHSIQKGVLSSMVQAFLTLHTMQLSHLLADYGIWLHPSRVERDVIL